jgi:hypothetical protein
MRSINVNNRTVSRRAARAVGLKYDNSSYVSVASQKAVRHLSEIVSLPGGASRDNGNTLQVTDPTDPNFGKFKYMAGYDPIGSVPLG